MTTNQQLELGINRIPSRPTGRRDERMARAAWWFAQMRRTVAAAIDWQTPPPEPKQRLLLGIRSK